MILYPSWLTINRMHFVMSECEEYPFDTYADKVYEIEHTLDMFEWFLDIFYYNGKRCIRSINLASNFTIFYYDLKYEHVRIFGSLLKQEVLNYFADSKEYTNLIKRYYDASPVYIYKKVQNKDRVKHFLKEGLFNKNSPIYSDLLKQNPEDLLSVSKAFNTKTQIFQNTLNYTPQERFIQLLKII